MQRVGVKKRSSPHSFYKSLSPINVESPNMECEEAPIILANHCSEHCSEGGLKSPQTPMNDNLS